eukprot:Tbor_TRINITY_DN4062_c0_g1::TRINITY_DN4062_c0_g1_i1::g.11782::m.11782
MVDNQYPQVTPWLDAIVLIRFDLFLGPTVETVFPQDNPELLDDNAKTYLIQCVFPDTSTDGDNTTLIYSFSCLDVLCRNPVRQIRTPPHTRQFSSSSVDYREKGERNGLSSSHRNTSGSSIFGSAYFRQKKDISCPRGYVQQALIILSSLPYYHLLEMLMRSMALRFGQCCLQSPDDVSSTAPTLSSSFSLAAVNIPSDPKFQSCGVTQVNMLQSAWSEICREWPSDVCCSTSYRLPFMGDVIVFDTPPRNHASVGFLNEMNNSDRVINGSTIQRNLSTPKNSSYSYPSLAPSSPLRNIRLCSNGLVDGNTASLWIKLWEKVLCHEPILVIASDPAMASAAAMGVESLVLPLRHRNYSSTICLSRNYSHEDENESICKSQVSHHERTRSKNGTSSHDWSYKDGGGAFFRPYVTIQDPDCVKYNHLSNFRELMASTTSGYIVGSTNPFFMKSLEGWGCTLSVIDPKASDRISIFLKTEANSGKFLVRKSLPSLSPEKRQSFKDERQSSNITIRHADECTSSRLKVSLTLGAPDSPSSTSTKGIGSSIVDSACCGTFSATGAHSFKIDYHKHGKLLKRRLEMTYKIMAQAQAVNDMVDDGSMSKGAIEVTNMNHFSGSLPSKMTVSGGEDFNKLPVPTMADEVACKFFESLTQEFLSPLNAWFQDISSNLKPFQICCPQTAQNLLSPQGFALVMQNKRAAKQKPPLYSHKRYAEYEPIYRAFCTGPLFASWRESVCWNAVESNLNKIIEEGGVYIGSSQSRIIGRDLSDADLTDMFVNLHLFAFKERWFRRDPDVIFVEKCRVVLKIIAAMSSQRDIFYEKISQL